MTVQYCDASAIIDAGERVSQRQLTATGTALSR
jgi:hypothetical protein